MESAGISNDPSNAWFNDYLKRMMTDYSGGWAGQMSGGGGPNTINWRDYTYGNAGGNMGNYNPGGGAQNDGWGGWGTILNSVPWARILGQMRSGRGNESGGGYPGGASTGTWNPGVVNPSGRPTATETGPRVPTGAGTGIPEGTVPGASRGGGLGSTIAKGTAGVGGMLLPLLLSGNGGSTAAGQFSGDLSNQLQQLLTGYLPNAATYMQNAGNMNPYQEQLNQLWSIMGSNLPQDYGQQIWNQLSGTNQMAGRIGQQGNQAVQGIQGLWDQIRQYGLPNQGAIEGMVPGQLGQYNAMQGNSGNPYAGGDNYGVSQLLQQIMGQGLPGQGTIQGMVTGQNTSPLISGYNRFSDPNYTGGDASSTYGIQDLLQQLMAKGLPGQTGVTDMGNKLSQQASSGGLTPEIINAYKSLLLQPQQEALQGNLNRQGGGMVAVPQIDQYGNMTSAESGALGEVMRRNERDFNNQLLTKGFENQQGLSNAATNAMTGVAGAFAPYAGLAGNLGLGQGTQALNAFNSIGSQAFPYINLANQSGQQGIQNALQAFQVTPSTVFPWAQMSGNLGQGSQQLGLQGLLSGLNQMGNYGQNQMGNLTQLLNQENQYQLGQQGQQSDLARTLLSGLFGNQASEAQLSAADKQMLGQIIQGGLSAAPGIYEMLKKIFKWS